MNYKMEVETLLKVSRDRTPVYKTDTYDEIEKIKPNHRYSLLKF